MQEEKKPIDAVPIEASEPLDIFTEAAKMTIDQSKTINVKVEKITNHNISLPANKKVRKNWGELREAIDNEHAERFNKILNELPDREFARVYLKSLEFFKPKVIRQAGDKKEEQNTVINIQINR